MAILALERYSIPESAKGLRNKREHHSHLEGSLSPDQLIAIAEDVGISLSAQTCEAIKHIFNEAATHAQNSKEKRTLPDFINRLSTRWMRFLHAKIILNEDYSPEQARAKQRQLQRLFVNTNLNQVYNIQGQEFINMLFSPYNMAGDGGDLGYEKLRRLSRGSLIDDERDTYADLKGMSPEKYAQRTVTWEEYTQTVAQASDEFEEKAKAEGRKFQVFKTVSLRRNEVEHFFLQESLQGSNTTSEVVRTLHSMFANQIIDAVDICGDESKKDYSLEKMSAFLQALVERKVIVTVHAGEVQYLPHRKLGRNNLLTVQSLKDVEIIAHGLRILDHQNDDLFLDASNREQILAWNFLSNEATGLTRHAAHHPAARHFGRIAESNTIDVYTTDDHIAITPEHVQMFLQNEQQVVVDAILGSNKGKYSKETIEDYLDAQSYRAMLKLQTDLESHRAASRDLLKNETATQEVVHSLSMTDTHPTIDEQARRIIQAARNSV